MNFYFVKKGASLGCFIFLAEFIIITIFSINFRFIPQLFYVLFIYILTGAGYGLLLDFYNYKKLSNLNNEILLYIFPFFIGSVQTAAFFWLNIHWIGLKIKIPAAVLLFCLLFIPFINFVSKIVTGKWKISNKYFFIFKTATISFLLITLDPRLIITELLKNIFKSGDNIIYLTARSAGFILVSIVVALFVETIKKYLSSIKLQLKKVVFFITSNFVIISFLIIFFTPLKIGGQNNSLNSKPDIILIIADTLRADHLSLYGYNRDTTPELKKLAKDAIVFTDFFSSSNTTPHSLKSALSLKPQLDRYAGIVWRGNYQSRTDNNNLFLKLKQNGYYTALISDYPSLILNAYDSFQWDYLSIDQRFQFSLCQLPFLLFNIFSNNYYGLRDLSNKWQFHIRGSIEDEIKYVLKQNRPKFIIIHLAGSHDPYGVFQYESNKFGKNIDKYKTNNEWRLYGITSKSNSIKQEVIDLYDNSIYSVDRKVSNIIRTIKRSYKNYLVFFMGDHGESFGEHGYDHHDRSFFQELVHVPFMIFGNKIKADVVNQPAGGFDIIPTILNIAGIKKKYSGTGQPLLSNNYELLSLPSDRQIVSIHPKGFMLIKDGWKYIYTYPQFVSKNSTEQSWAHKNVEELYDLKNDPQEIENLAKIDQSRTKNMHELLFKCVEFLY